MRQTRCNCQHLWGQGHFISFLSWWAWQAKKEKGFPRNFNFCLELEKNALRARTFHLISKKLLQFKWFFDNGNNQLVKISWNLVRIIYLLWNKRNLKTPNFNKIFTFHMGRRNSSKIFLRKSWVCFSFLLQIPLKMRLQILFDCFFFAY
jgi:hypothetical protein